MSSIEGKLESPTSSTRGKVSPDELQNYSSRWIKWMVDKLFPARPLNFEGDRGVASRTRR